MGQIHRYHEYETRPTKTIGRHDKTRLTTPSRAPITRTAPVTGTILQGEIFPGIHISFGNPYGEHGGAPWRSGTHIDVVASA